MRERFMGGNDALTAPSLVSPPSVVTSVVQCKTDFHPTDAATHPGSPPALPLPKQHQNHHHQQNHPLPSSSSANNYNYSFRRRRRHHHHHRHDRHQSFFLFAFFY